MIMSQHIKIATAQYEIGQHNDWQQYSQKIEQWVVYASEKGADLLLFPEYGGIELASINRVEGISIDQFMQDMQPFLPDFLELHHSLSRKFSVCIVAGSLPVLTDDGYKNRVHFFDPQSEEVGFQDKLQLTRYEKENSSITAGNKIKVFATRWGNIGINVCYDSEFPLIARTQVEQGVNLILVPSCTDTLAGYHRVKIGCQARALENQCYVVQSPLVGEADWSEVVDVNIGAAAVFTPVDRGFPDDGVLKVGNLNQSQWVIADIDLAMIEDIRNTGQVFNYRDWPSQYRLI